MVGGRQPLVEVEAGARARASAALYSIPRQRAFLPMFYGKKKNPHLGIM